MENEKEIDFFKVQQPKESLIKNEKLTKKDKMILLAGSCASVLGFASAVYAGEGHSSLATTLVSLVGLSGSVELYKKFNPQNTVSASTFIALGGLAVMTLAAGLGEGVTSQLGKTMMACGLAGYVMIAAKKVEKKLKT